MFSSSDKRKYVHRCSKCGKSECDGDRIRRIRERGSCWCVYDRNNPKPYASIIDRMYSYKPGCSKCETCDETTYHWEHTEDGPHLFEDGSRGVLWEDIEEKCGELFVDMKSIEQKVKDALSFINWILQPETNMQEQGVIERFRCLVLKYWCHDDIYSVLSSYYDKACPSEADNPDFWAKMDIIWEVL